MKRIISILFILVLSISVFAQNDKFNIIYKLNASPVKNQYRSNTCWSFSVLSLLESELLRMGKGEYDLSEMFIVKHSYIAKAKKYVRLQGHLHFTAGGEFDDVLAAIEKYGIVPEEVYDGKRIGEKQHVHGEMDEVLKSYVDAIIKNATTHSPLKITPVWDEGFELVLNAYLGTIPQNFLYKERKYTPETFYKSLGIDISKYILVTSFSHHPFYSNFILEVPDNWSWGSYYNIPLPDLFRVVELSLQKGYTVGWSSDISEDGFSWEQGLAELNAETEKIPITQELRQAGFDNFQTTDDHGMHIIGMAKNDEGKKYLLVKNSWGNEGSSGGYLYASEKYFQYKTIAILINKEVLPDDLKSKLGIK